MAGKVDARRLCPNEDRAVGHGLNTNCQVRSLPHPQPVQRAFEKPVFGKVEAGAANKFQTGSGGGDGRYVERAFRSQPEFRLKPGGLARLLLPGQRLQPDPAGLKTGLDDIFGGAVPIIRANDVDLDGNR